MKKILSLVLAAACMPVMLLASCASGGAGAYSPKITVASSDAEDSAEFLTNRLGEKLTDNVYLAVGSDTANGIDMTDFENDGYVLRTVGDKSVVIVGKSADGLDLGVRRYANSVDEGKDEYFDVAYHEGYRIENFTLAGTDIAEYSIEYPAEHNENMLFAVSELQRLVKKACGAELSASEGITKKARAIEFRHSTDAELKFDGYRYFFEGERLVIEGAVKRGCMYGVWRFLQKECGWTSLIYTGTAIFWRRSISTFPRPHRVRRPPCFHISICIGTVGVLTMTIKVIRIPFRILTGSCRSVVTDFTGSRKSMLWVSRSAIPMRIFMSCAATTSAATSNHGCNPDRLSEGNFFLSIFRRTIAELTAHVGNA